jgi:hypothetical protein
MSISGKTVLAAIPRKDTQGHPVAPLRRAYTLSETKARDAIVTDALIGDPDLTWYQCKSMIASSGDECRVGSWVFARGRFGRTDETTVRVLSSRI